MTQPDKLMVKAICMHGIDIRSAICNRCNSMTRAEADEELALRKMLFDTMRENERLLAISDKVTALTNDSSMICDELRWDALIEWCDKQELPYKHSENCSTCGKPLNQNIHGECVVSHKHSKTFSTTREYTKPSPIEKVLVTEWDRHTGKVTQNTVIPPKTQEENKNDKI